MQKTKERAAQQTQVRPHSYTTLVVHVEPGLASAQRTEVAARPAHPLDARLVGVGD
jgi:hypothetical protein